LTHGQFGSVTVKKSLDEKIVFKKTSPAAPTKFAQSALTQRCVAF
jgi:hypothetical protein